MRKLSVKERAYLREKLKKARDRFESNRLCVILGYDEGITKVTLAHTLRISAYTVDAYLREYDSSNKTNSSPKGGSESKLSEEQKESLVRHLQQTTYLKVQAICAYVTEHFGIQYSRTGMRDWLIREGFTYKRPERVPGKLDPEKQRIFIEQYEALKQSLGPNEEIYFIDASHPEYQSQSVCGWIKKGEKKTLQTTGKQSRLHIAGALRLDELQILTEEYKTIDAEAMVDFFSKLEKFTQAKTIHVVLDNARAHKNKLLESALSNSRIKLHYLPPYSPNLNPIERLWKLMRERVHYNRYHASAEEFFRSIRAFLSEQIPKMGEVLKARLNDRFQAVTLNPIRLAG